MVDNVIWLSYPALYIEQELKDYTLAKSAEKPEWKSTNPSPSSNEELDDAETLAHKCRYTVPSSNEELDDAETQTHKKR